MARMGKTSHDTTLDKHQNTCRARGSVRHRDSPPGAADLGTPGLRTIHWDLLSRPLRSAAKSLASTAHRIDVGKLAVHPSGSQRTQPRRGAADHSRVDAAAMPLV